MKKLWQNVMQVLSPAKSLKTKKQSTETISTNLSQISTMSYGKYLLEGNPIEMPEKKIGILVWRTDNGMFIRKSYVDFFKQFGKVVLVMPDQDVDTSLDLLVLPGGADLSNSLTGTFSPMNNPDNPSYTYFYNYSFKKWLGKVPMFGICLGFQGMAVAMGSTLSQHLRGHQLDDNKLHDLVQQVDAKRSKVVQKINSRHHQAFFLGSIKGMKEIYHSSHFTDANSLVEMARNKELKISGVQWHPEDMEHSRIDMRGDQIAIKEILTLLNVSF